MTAPRHCEAQPTRQSSPSNNASGHMPFLTRWIATAYGLAMTAPRLCEQRTSPQRPQANKAIQRLYPTMPLATYLSTHWIAALRSR